MKYVCEICNNQFDTPGAAERCEYGHKREQMQRAAKDAAAAKISDAVNAFITKYGEAPAIHLTEENEALAFGEVVNNLGEVFDVLLDLFSGGECGDENCEGCEQCGERCNHNAAE